MILSWLCQCKRGHTIKHFMLALTRRKRFNMPGQSGDYSRPSTDHQLSLTSRPYPLYFELQQIRSLLGEFLCFFRFLSMVLQPSYCNQSKYLSPKRAPVLHNGSSSLPQHQLGLTLISVDELELFPGILQIFWSPLVLI